MNPLSLPEPARELVGNLITSNEPPMPWQIGHAIDIIRVEITAAQIRLDTERRRLPHLERVYLEKRSLATLKATGTSPEKKAKADLATLSEKFDVDVCEQAIKAGVEYGRVLEKSLSAVQSIGGLLRAEMSALGNPFGGQG